MGAFTLKDWPAWGYNTEIRIGLTLVIENDDYDYIRVENARWVWHSGDQEWVAQWIGEDRDPLSSEWRFLELPSNFDFEILD